MSNQTGKYDFEKEEVGSSGLKKSGIGFRSWSLKTSSLLVGVRTGWPRKTFIAGVPPSMERGNQSGVHVVTDLDHFLTSYSANDVVGIVKWGGRVGKHTSENVIRAEKTTIVYLFVSESTIEGDFEILNFLESKYKVPVETYTDIDDLRAKILAVLPMYSKKSVAYLQSSDSPMDRFRREEDYKRIQSENRYKHDPGEGRNIQFEAEVEHYENRSKFFKDSPVTFFIIYFTRVPGTGEGLGLDSKWSFSRKETSTLKSLDLQLATGLLKDMFIMVVEKHLPCKWGPPDSATAFVGDARSLYRAQPEVLIYVDESGEVLIVRDTFGFFHSHLRGGKLVSMEEVLDRIDEEIDPTKRSEIILSSKYFEKEPSPQLDFAFTPRDPSQDWKITSYLMGDSGSSPKYPADLDLNKLVLVRGFKNYCGRDPDLVDSSIDRLTKGELDNYEIDYTIERVTDKRTGESLNFSECREGSIL